jgi:hypothetical protein
MKSLLAPVVLLATSLALPAYGGEVKLQVANGRITLQAHDATVREILAEWARVGQVKIVNAEKIMGAPVTIEFQSVPEAQALNTLLRSVSGYMAAPKADFAAGGSIYDRIIIMAAPRTQVASTGYTAPPPQPNAYRPGMPPGAQNPAGLDDPDEPAGPPPTYPGGQPVYPGAGISRSPIPQIQPQGGQVPATGTIPQGAPGTISPMPQVPNVPGQQVVQPTTGAPGAVSQPVKKPGGPGGAGPGGEGGE